MSFTYFLNIQFFWQAGVSVVRYDGCTQCNLHVWHEKEKSDLCPICKERGEEQIRTRYDALVNKLTKQKILFRSPINLLFYLPFYLQRRPRESIFHFPIKERLESLIRDSPAFYEALHHELYRLKPPKGTMYGLFFRSCMFFRFALLSFFPLLLQFWVLPPPHAMTWPSYCHLTEWPVWALLPPSHFPPPYYVSPG